MAKRIFRVFVEKKPGFDVEATRLYRDLKDNLGLKNLEKVRILNRYDVEGITEEEYRRARQLIFAEPPVDRVYDEEVEFPEGARVLAVEYLPGQYDQRADSAAQCLQIITQRERPLVRCAKVLIFEGKISQEEFLRIKKYLINPVDSREASLAKPENLAVEVKTPQDVPVLTGFISMNQGELAGLHRELGLAMSLEDLQFCQQYFREEEKRDPTLTEIRVLDTYWSDHCRHTTFNTEITEVEIGDGTYAPPIKKAYEAYLQGRRSVHGASRPMCLMDLATLAMKEMRQQGRLADLDVSEEINASSIAVEVDVDGRREEWLVMFKNETHNHPTEIEPFGGAATCLGGAIRDPLSGRAYVYQAMRVTGSGDPRAKIEDTLPGKLPQRKITVEAARGYSSYGNQIGLATGQVAEIYHPGFVAKRMEIGAVIGAVPKENVVRQRPREGDVVILVGERTGRDGCGGATGSSKPHTENSLLTCGAEVQKGNAPTERKLQRLFRNPQVSRLIKRCNDLGAGGVSVALGELTDGLDIQLDAIPKKYEGLDGTELAISESQERMAVVIAPEDVEKFLHASREENLEATVVATVTAQRRLRMFWCGKAIVDLSRDFLNTHGVRQRIRVKVNPPTDPGYFAVSPLGKSWDGDLKKAWLDNLKDLNVCSQKGLVEQFDSTVGAGTVLMPLGGKFQATPAEGMVAKIPVYRGETSTATVMTFGYDPKLSQWSPFHGACYAVLEAVAKVVALGGDYRKIRLSLQEYFQRLGKDPQVWGKPFSALLGAYYAQKELGIPAIGGKDSMSGTFKDLHVPPTVVAFAVTTVHAGKVVSQEFKKSGSLVVLVKAPKDEYGLPHWERVKKGYTRIWELIQAGQVLASHTVKYGGIAAAISKMCFGNRIGMKFTASLGPEELFKADYGSIILEIEAKVNLEEAFRGVEYQVLGRTQEKESIVIGEVVISLKEALRAWEEPLEKIFPTQTDPIPGKPETFLFPGRNRKKPKVKVARPRVLIPVFPGTNCEYESARAFTKAGGMVQTLVVKNLTASQIEESIAEMVKAIKNSQIIMLPGGFSAGDEPDGSGKFIASFFRNPRVQEAVMEFLKNRDGLMLGICNGFQALIKLGLVPYGEIVELTEDSPILTFNKIGRHVSRMVRTKVVSTLSPWFSKVQVGDVHTIPISHGEGRFVAPDKVLEQLFKNGQIATQYVDFAGEPSYEVEFNPNGSLAAVEGITSPDGRVLGKMGHSERVGKYVAVNVPGEKDQRIFEAGVEYFL